MFVFLVCYTGDQIQTSTSVTQSVATRSVKPYKLGYAIFVFLTMHWIPPVKFVGDLQIVFFWRGSYLAFIDRMLD